MGNILPVNADGPAIQIIKALDEFDESRFSDEIIFEGMRKMSRKRSSKFGGGFRDEIIFASESRKK